MLSALTAQFALLYYILIFASAYKILKKSPALSLSHKILITLLPAVACLVSFFGIVVGFIPPKMIDPNETFSFILTMGIGFLTVILIPVFILLLRPRNKLLS